MYMLNADDEFMLMVIFVLGNYFSSPSSSEKQSDLRCFVANGISVPIFVDFLVFVMLALALDRVTLFISFAVGTSIAFFKAVDFIPLFV